MEEKMSKKKAEYSAESRMPRVIVLALIIFIPTVVLLWVASSAKPAASAPAPILEIQAGQQGANPNYNRHWEDLARIVPKFVDDPILGPTAKSLVDRLGYYKDFFNYYLPKAADLQIDYILQAHVEQISDPRNDMLVQMSQVRLKEILELVHYDVIGFEGGVTENVTFDSLLEEAKEYGKTTGTAIDPEKLRESVMASRNTDGVLQFLFENPNSKVVGLEDRPLVHLHFTTLGLIPEQPTRQELDELSDVLRYARSMYATARIIKKLHDVHGTRGVIPFGYRHGPEVRELATTLGFGSRFYTTLSDAYVDLSWAKQ
jgi:hypothetical protein